MTDTSDRLILETATRLFGSGADAQALGDSGLLMMWERQDDGGSDLGLGIALKVARVEASFAAANYSNGFTSTIGAACMASWQKRQQEHLSPQPIAPQSIAPDPIAILLDAAIACGLGQAMLNLSLEHAGTREQFGRPLAKFQAIQHRLAAMAGAVSASEAALLQASTEVRLWPDDDWHGSEQHAAKCAAAQCFAALETISAHAHQIHGAMGFTHEYDLSRLTKTALALNSAAGREFVIAEQLGTQGFAVKDFAALVLR